MFMEDGAGHVTRVRWISAALGVFAAILIVCFVDLAPDKPAVTRAAAVALLIGTLWLTEVLPLAVTSLLPLVLFPLLGIASGEQVAREYFQDVIFVFLGGFIVALAMQRWNLHQRVAMFILSSFGSSPGRLVLGFLVSTAALSMWISNTAAAMMMVTIALAVLRTADERLEREAARRTGVALMLAVAYGSTIGGIATLVGTPPNLVFVQMFRDRFPEAPPISFARWMMFACPIAAILLGCVWLLLVKCVMPRGQRDFISRETLTADYRRLGPTRFPEWAVMATFGAMVVLWITRNRLDLGGIQLFGWSLWFDKPKFITDGTVSIAMALLLFLVPVRKPIPTTVMNWETAARLPWHIVLLFGGGFALAKGIEQSGLSMWLGDQLQGFGVLPIVAFLLLICAGICFVSEFTSNTATTQLVLPILAAIAVRLEVNPLMLMLPATIACSWGFMMPVGTPPNAIVFGTGRVRITEMARVGLIVNLLAVAITVLAMMAWGRWVWGIDATTFPDWAR